MMTPRQRVTWIVIISLAIILFLVFIIMTLFFRSKKPVEQPVVAPVVELAPAPVITNQILKQENDTRNGSSVLIAFAKMFAERYGSYSNQANFQNIRDVIPLMSQSFGEATKTSLEQKKAPEGFYGVTTRVITVTLKKSDEKEGTATIVLTTQRSEEKDS
ncbi:MAG: hypothetical protein AAB664_03120, partial [Patescibacteria group bacterium]